MANISGEKELKTDWPITEGLIAGTNKLRKEPHLIPEKDLTDQNNQVGM